MKAVRKTATPCGRWVGLVGLLSGASVVALCGWARAEQRRVVSAGAETDKNQLPCGSVTKVGCCLADGRLLFCDGRILRVIDCRERPLCGWRETGMYSCDTGGHVAPTDRYPKYCPANDPQVQRLEAEKNHLPNRCGGVTEVGCCDGSVLKLCRNGMLREIDCRNNLECGWRGTTQVYNCGTAGVEDPSGRHRRACRPEQQAALPVRRGAPGGVRSPSGAADSGERTSQSCSQAPDGEWGNWTIIVLFAWLVGSSAFKRRLSKGLRKC